jgi:halimadienyl-diphosphate synthase
MNSEEEIRILLEEIGSGHMSSTAYDTAWVARLGEINPGLSYQAMEWVCANQLPDGSWGAKDMYYYHDRVICTLAAMIALTYRGRRARDRQQIDLGLKALENMISGATKGLQADPSGATIGFEMIVPTLVSEAHKLGILKQQGESILKRLGEQRAKKLEKIQGKLISKNTTMAFSAEMAGADGQHILDLQNLQETNGSVGHSPSATAYYSLYVNPKDQSALKYLEGSLQEDGGVPNVAPFDTFEISWALWNLRLIPGFEISPKTQTLLNVLSDAWQPKSGIGFATQYSVRDSDVTSFVFDTLSRFGIQKDIESILAYEENDYFRCYPLEANPSVSANIHVLGALRQAGMKKTHPTIQKLLGFLRQVKGRNPYWMDKWHSSPYYTTSHAIIACVGYLDEFVEEAVMWLLSSQRSSGAWGIYLQTAEETAYALQALCLWKRSGGAVPAESIKKGMDWLLKNSRPPYHPLWIGKALYCPKFVVQATILSAIELARQTL